MTIKYLLLGAALTAIAYLLGAFLGHIRLPFPMSAERGKTLIKHRESLFFEGLCLNIFFGCASIFAFVRAKYVFAAIFLAIALIGVVKVHIYISCAIIFDKNEICFRNFFRREKRLRISDIAELYEKKNRAVTCFVSERQRYSVSLKIPYTEEGKELIALCNAEYKNKFGTAKHSSSSVIERMFGNSLKNPLIYLVTFPAVFLCICGIYCWIYFTCASNYSELITIEHQLIFNSFEISDGETLTMYAASDPEKPNNEYPFVIKEINAYENYNELIKSLQRGEEFTVKSATFHEKGSPVYTVIAISSDSIVFFTEEETTALRADGVHDVLLFVKLTAVLWCCYAIAFFICVRYSFKFPRLTRIITFGAVNLRKNSSTRDLVINK